MSSSFEMKAAPQCFLQNSFLLDTICTEFAESHPDVLDNSAATPSCSHPIKQPSHCTAIPSYSHLIPQPFCPVATPVLQVTQCTTTPLHNHPILQPFHHTATPSHSHLTAQSPHPSAGCCWLSLQHHLRGNKTVHCSSHQHTGWLHPSIMQGACLKGSARISASDTIAEANSSPSSTSYIMNKPCVLPPPPAHTPGIIMYPLRVCKCQPYTNTLLTVLSVFLFPLKLLVKTPH